MIVATLMTSVLGALATFLALAPSNIWMALVMAPFGGSLLVLFQGLVIAGLRRRRSQTIDALTDGMVADLNYTIAAARRSGSKEDNPIRLRKAG